MVTNPYLGVDGFLGEFPLIIVKPEYYSARYRRWERREASKAFQVLHCSGKR